MHKFRLEQESEDPLEHLSILVRLPHGVPPSRREIFVAGIRPGSTSGPR